MIERTIVITMRGGNDFDVREGDSYCDRLCWDEMLGHVASMTHPSINAARYQMLTAEQHAERQRQREQRMAEIAAEKNDRPLTAAEAFETPATKLTIIDNTNQEEGKQP